MIAFLMGVAVACGVSAACPGLAETLLDDGSGSSEAGAWSWALVWMVAAQVLAAGLAADLVHGAAARAFLARGRFSFPAIALGLCVGTIAALLIVVALAAAFPWTAGHPLRSPVLATVITGATSAAVLLLSHRRRAGSCAECGYDLARLTPSTGGRCPECGRDQFKLA